MYLVCALAHGKAHIASQTLHSGANIVSNSHPCRSKLIDPPFLRYDYLEIWKYKYRAMSKVKGQGHVAGPTTYLLTSLSFHVNRPSHPWGMAI